MNRRGYSLIELMTVIGTVAVIGAIAWPAMRDAREAARRAVCAHNLRQMVIAYGSYMADQDGRLFPWQTNTADGTLWYWGLERAGGGGEGARSLDRSRGYLAPYLSDSGVETCPSFPYRSTQYKRKFETASYGYGLNHFLIRGLPANRTAGILNFRMVTRPAETILWGDSAQVNTHQPPASSRNPMLEEWYYLSHLEPTFHFRHGRKVQVAMADGAVRLLPPGRLRPECDGLVGNLEAELQIFLLNPIK